MDPKPKRGEAETGIAEKYRNNRECQKNWETGNIRNTGNTGETAECKEEKGECESGKGIPTST